MYFCPYSDCSNHDKVGPDNQIIAAGCYGKHQAQVLKCKVCDRTFSERRGTPLFNLKASEETFYDVIACLVEGNGIRATARIKKVDKDTVAPWLDKASQHVEAVSRHLMVNLHFEEVQLDEFWSFQKREAQCTALEKLQTEYGDHWACTPFTRTGDTRWRRTKPAQWSTVCPAGRWNWVEWTSRCPSIGSRQRSSVLPQT
jgi:transposase-like protein